MCGQLVAVHDGQADVEKRNLRRELCRHAQRGRCVVGDTRVVALAAERVGQHLGAVGVVVDDENSRSARSAARSALPRSSPCGLRIRRARARSTAAGTRTANSLPRPGPSLCADTEPPWRSTRFRTIVNPMPSPPCDRSMAWRSWTNRSKMRGSISGAMPMPVSRTRSTTSSSTRSAADRDAARRAGVYLAALVRRFETTWLRRVGSPSTRDRVVARPRSTCDCAARAAGSPSRWLWPRRPPSRRPRS